MNTKLLSFLLLLVLAFGTFLPVTQAHAQAEAPIPPAQAQGGIPLITLYSCTTQSQIPQPECNALVALYTSTNGSNWIGHSGWLQTAVPPCSWYGVTCAGGHVSELQFNYNQLSGVIPRELGNLAQLQYLNLDGNQLSGAIPPELGNLAQLQYLNLAQNQLSGAIPPELGNLAQLQYFLLDQNQLSGAIPPELGNLAQLQYLNLDGNQLSGAIPPELGNLAQLQSLSLYYNQLSGAIPPELGNLAQLQGLFLSNNQLSGAIPPELGNLTQLQYLSLKFNQLSGDIPTTITNLTQLAILSFDCWLTSPNATVTAFILSIDPGWKNCPLVQAITCASANPTSAASVDFTVTFSENVTGVDAGDFDVTVGGHLLWANVIAVNGSGSSYTVTVSTGKGDGTLRLDVPVTAAITDLAGNPLGGLPFTVGHGYMVSRPVTFSDVPGTYWAWQHIERLYNAGITGGCTSTPLNYCPETAVTRAQMAVFLLVAKHGAGYTPPAATGLFSDVPASNGFAPWIEQMAAEGITGGCGGGKFCPNDAVTREQMAVFLLVAEHGAGYNPPAAVGMFSDIPTGNPFAKWIEQLANEGITGGCGGGKFCPKTPVTRAQMAVFLVAAFNLP